ncbi:chromosome replication initiation protein [Planctomycetaceae bacterium SCGC AG-212-D15]|nr:chromosome replication initiation protein [Planctomycetaceae bacterium SCGC AG-212-D15]
MEGPLTTVDHGVVAELGHAIARRIGEPRYQFWFRNHTKFRWDDDILTVGAPNRFFQEWLESKFAEDVRAAALGVLGRPMEVRFVIDADLFQAARRAEAGGEPTATEAVVAVHAVAATDHEPEFTATRVAVAARRPAVRQRHWRRLNDFVVGACNRLAHAAALSAVEDPGEGANPLVLHGPVGVGKTHLLEGIYAATRKARPDSRVCFAPAEEFTNRFVQAMRLGKLGGFRKHYRECDLLLVDDINFLAGKRATQEEFLHTFDALLADGRQIVVACDCHPKLADEYLPELADRLLGGACWGVTPPDADTRLAILRAKAGRGDEPFPDDVLQLIAGSLRGNVRELEGAVHSVRHYARVVGRRADQQMAREALGELLRHSVRSVGLADVDEAVCRALHLAGGALQAKQRAWAVSHPRMVAMYLARKHTAAAYSEIGQHFGGRNHSTVVAAEKKVRRWIEEDAELSVGERRLRVREVVERAERELLR